MRFSFSLQKGSGIPVYIQLEEQIRLLVHEGVLKAGDLLPTTRALAVELGINANTVARVYRDLQNDGLLRLERGVGSFIADTATLPLQKREMKSIEKKARDLIQICHAAGMTAAETCQLIRGKWEGETYDKEKP